MQLVPLSTDGRVDAVVTAPLPLGPLRVALRMAGAIVAVEALGPGRPRRVGRLTPADAATYGPVLTRLAGRGHVGTCPARVTRTGEAVTLTLQLGSSATCAPRDAPCSAPLPIARTTKLLAAVPGPRTASRRACPPRSATGPRPHVAAGTARVAMSAPVRRPPLPARPPAHFGQAEDAPPRLTPCQRRRILWASIGIAALLLLAFTVQHSVTPPTDSAAVATAAVCSPVGAPTCRSPRP